MNRNALFAALPDFSARIMRHTVTSDLKIRWEVFCSESRLKPLRLDEGMSELHAEDELRLQQGFATLTSNHRDLWFGVGLRYQSFKYGTLGLAMMTARTLAEALDVAARYQALTYSLINYRFASAPNGACALIGDTEGLFADLRDFSYHRDLGAIKTLITDLTAGIPVLDRVRIAAPPPCNWEAVKAHFTCPVEFDADQTQWIFVPGSAGRQLPWGDADSEILYRSLCEQQLDKAQANASITQRLVTLLNANDGHVLTAGEAARQLALSARSLHRRLAEEGTLFSTIADEARYRRARALLADRNRTIDAISFAMGFAEPSSFSRAFKRWSGTSAIEFRRHLIDGHGR
ncbi:AraC family transcriptional regulator ligand-binding domain-containing protein [Xanthobacter autotrophicus]|uniref:AraC family transcriptional regulator n=1 Tax=Xanthobacter autotrophicus TaxID=280 RepID=UPI00372C1DAE